MITLANFKTPLPRTKHSTDFFSIMPDWEFLGFDAGFRFPTIWHVRVANLDLGSSRVQTLRTYFWVQRLIGDYFPGYFTAVNFSSIKTVTFTIRPDRLLHVLNFFKNSMLFNCLSLTDLWVTDFPSRKNRFEITYSLLSTKKNTRIYVKIFVNEWYATQSVTSLFASAGWFEREAWDMFGVTFSGHPDLRRILTDYGFLGFPLRKDFPLTGFFELRYDDTTRRVVSERVNLIQELRLFFFLTPWKQK